MINYLYQEQNWQSQLSDLITDPLELLHALQLSPEQLLSGAVLASEKFKLRVPRAFVAKMCVGDPESFEQIAADKNAMGDAAKWLKDDSNEACTIMLFNGVPLNVSAPNFVTLKIIETDPGVRGDTSGGGGKPAKLETGAVVRVPLFVQQEESVRVDTRTGEYLERA